MQHNPTCWSIVLCIIAQVFGPKLYQVDATGTGFLFFGSPSGQSFPQMSSTPNLFGSTSNSFGSTYSTFYRPSTSSTPFNFQPSSSSGPSHTNFHPSSPSVSSSSAAVPSFSNVHSNSTTHSTSAPEAASSIPSATIGATSHQSSSRAKWSATTEFCQSASCKFFAQTFLSKLDWDSWSCDDFYDFVCRKTLHPKTESERRGFGSSSVVKEPETLLSLSHSEIDRNIKSLVDTKRDSMARPQTTRELSANLSRLRNLYASCNRDRRGNYRYIVEFIKNFGGFPLAGSRSGWTGEARFDWLETTLKFRQAGLNLDQFFDFGPKTDGDHYRLKIGVTTQDSLGNTFMASDILKSLYAKREDSSTSNPFGQPTAPWYFDVDMNSQLNELGNFRSDLRQIIRSEKSSLDYYKFEDIISKFPQIDWLKLLGGLVRQSDNFLKYPIIIQDKEKVEKLLELLKRTKPEVLANHMMLSFIDLLGPYAEVYEGGHVQQTPFGSSFSSTMSVQTRPLHRNYLISDCKEVLLKHLGLALSVEYFTAYIGQSLVDRAHDIVSKITDEMKMMIEEADWISDKLQAGSKINSLKINYGVARELRRSRSTDWFYKGLELDSQNFFENLMSINRAKYDIYLNDLLNKETERFEWVEYDSQLMVKADGYYNNLKHRIYLPINIMNLKYLDSSNLDSINYAIFGTKVAHLMMNALGLRQMMKEVSEIKLESDEKYSARLECLRKQYDGLVQEGADWLVSGDATMISNMADNAGVEIAYRAFSRISQSRRDRPRLLRGIPLRTNELFWASYAIGMCTKFENQRQIDVLRYGPQSPPKFRVNIPLSNYESFSFDFACPIESNMNPIDKCVTWSEAENWIDTTGNEST